MLAAPVDPFPRHARYALTPEHYLDHIRKAKEAVNIPIIASLNCASIGGWAEYAKQMQQAGADALELNIYYVPTDLQRRVHRSSALACRSWRTCASEVQIPLAVKIGPYYSNMANMAWRFERAGADALVLFNRFYQPDINLESMSVTSTHLAQHSTGHASATALDSDPVWPGSYRLRGHQRHTRGLRRGQDAAGWSQCYYALLRVDAPGHRLPATAGTRT